jgi:streptogramin lyase
VRPAFHCKFILWIFSLLFLTATASAANEDFVRTSVHMPTPAAPGFTKVGALATNLWTFNALNVYDSKLKTDVFYVTSFNSAGHGQLIRLDYHHNRAVSWVIPAGIGSWGIIQGQDGNLYLGSYNEGTLLCLNPRTGQWLPLPQLPEAFRKKNFVVCDLAQATDGKIYYGTVPGCHLVCYDPHTRKIHDLGRVANDEDYARWLAVTPSGIVIISVGSRSCRFIAYDPHTRKFSTLTPAAYRRPGLIAPPRVSADYIVEPTPDSLLVFDIRTLKLLHVFQVANVSGFNIAGFNFIDSTHLVYESGDREFKLLDLRTGKETAYAKLPFTLRLDRWYPTPGGNLLGLREQSYIDFNPRTEKAVRHRIPADGLGQNILWLRSFPNGQIYGGPTHGQTFFSYDPRIHRLRSYGQVIDGGGEIYYAVHYQGRLYSISYVEATLAVFDPTKPWNQGDRPDSNPRQILSVPQDQYRPEGGIHLGPGAKMYIGTQPDYGMLGGALSVFDPNTEKIQVYRNLIPNEESSAVGVDRRYVYCGTDVGGGGGSKPLARESHFFVWDPVENKIIFDQPLDTTDSLGSIAAARGHAYFVLKDKLMDYDSSRRTLKAIYSFALPRPVPLEGLKAAKDGTIWGLLDHELAHIDPAKRKVDFFPQTAGKAINGLTIGANGAVYFGSHSDVWIYHPRVPSPPLSYGQ